MATRGYQSYRGRNHGKLALVIVLVLILLAAVGYLVAQEYMVYDDEGHRHLELPFLKKGQTEQPQQPEDTTPDDVNLIIDEPERPLLKELHARQLPDTVLTEDSSAVLAEHPEGIMLHAACVPHGILLTEYKDGQFYCADPSEFAGTGIIPIEQAWGTRIENSNAYWYVSSEVADPTQAPVVPEASAASIHPDTTTLLTGPKADEEETACLIGQALGVHA